MQKELKNRIAQGKAAVTQLNLVVWSKQITQHTDKRQYKSIVESILSNKQYYL